MREEIMQELYKTFRLSERKGTGGMTFKYVPNEDVITRMNKVFNGNWSTTVMHKDIIEDQVLVEVQVSITDPDSQEIYVQTGYGSSNIARYKDGPNAGKIIDIGNAYKGSLSKAIVNACTRWGVGLIKERNALEEEVTAVAEIPAVPPPAAPVVASAPVVPSAPSLVAAPTTPPAPEPAQAKPTVVPPAPVVEAPIVPPAPEAPVVPSAPVAETTTIFPPPMMPDQKVSAELIVEQTKAPKVEAPAPVIDPSAGMPKPDLPFSKGEGLAGVVISDVQKVALNGILTMNSADYNELAKEAFGANGINKPVPNKEDLSYEEAVVVIKYGNEKYRKNR